MVNYVPKKRDIVFIDFSPIKGHEQSGVRPALVISSQLFNQFTKMALLCPITNNIKEFPTHYELKSSKKVTGAVLCENIRSIDYNKRNVKYIDQISQDEYDEILELIKSFTEGC